jgi:hypothetical protein
MDPQFRIDGVNDGVLLAVEWASNCVFRLFECVCDVATIWCRRSNQNQPLFLFKPGGDILARSDFAVGLIHRKARERRGFEVVLFGCSG